MTIPILRRVAMAAALLTTAAVLPGLPAYAAWTSTLAGTLTTSSGAAAPDVLVQVYSEDTNGNIDFATITTTDAQGRYAVTDMASGTYLVGFHPQDAPAQFYRQHRELWDADRIILADDATINADDQLMPTGIITGQIRTAAGAPVIDLPVTARDVARGNQVYGVTDAEGRYRIAAFTGEYAVSFEPIAGSYQTQYIPGQLDEGAARQIVVTAGGETVADDEVLPVGTLSGRFTTQSGAGISQAEVSLYTAGSGNYAGSRTANTNGEFTVNLLAGSYRIGFTDNVRSGQYYQGKLEFDEATPVTVTGGQTTTITDSWLPVGSVRVTAVDAVSGAVLPNFCVNDACSNGTGSATVTGLPQGQHDLNVYTDDHLHFNAAVNDVAVQGGTTIDLTVRLRPGAAITTTITDRATGTGVANVCLDAFLGKRVRLPDGHGYCSDSVGRITVGPLEPGMYRLFADPGSTTYGRQWVGATGGTGDERQAALVTTLAGRIATAPQVKMDKAGAITGQVTDAATGQPLADAHVGLLTSHPGAGVSEQFTDGTGHYRIDRLGPYEWPVIFSRHGGYATHWSGVTGSRYTATKVQVTAGGTATHHTALTKGTQVTGTLTNQDGAPAVGGWIMAHNADTGDITGGSWFDAGRFSMQLVPGQSVYFTYDADFGNPDRYYQGQYPLPPSTRSRPGGPVLVTPGIAVPTTGPLTVNIVTRTS